jgi:hypothetical protein
LIGSLADDHSDEQWRRIYEVLRRAWVMGKKPELIERLDEYLGNRTHPRAAYQLGHLLIDKGRLAMASGILARALQTNREDVELRHEVVASLELQGRYAEAADILEPFAGRSDAPFLTRYLRAFNLIASGRADVAETALRGLNGSLEPRYTFMRDRIERMLSRQRFAGSERTPRNVQFVMSGTLLFDDEWVDYREESWASLGANLVRLRTVLEAIDRMPARVVSLHGPRRDTLGKAAAALFHLPFHQQYLPEGEGLFLNTDLAALQPDLAEALKAHLPGRVYYAHYASTKRELSVAADAIGVRGDRVMSPWDLFAIVDYLRTDLPKGPPTESEDELARKIVDSSPHPSTLTDLPGLVDFARRASAAKLLALGAESGEREKVWPCPQ